MFRTVGSLPLALTLVALAQPTLAYVGPGAGLSLITAFGVLAAAILSSLAFLVLWPLRRARRRRKQEREQLEARQESPLPRNAEAPDAGPAAELTEPELVQRR